VRNVEIRRRVAALEKTVVPLPESTETLIARLRSEDRAIYYAALAAVQAMPIDEFLSDADPLPRHIFERIYGVTYTVLVTDTVAEAAERYRNFAANCR